MKIHPFISLVPILYLAIGCNNYDAHTRRDNLPQPAKERSSYEDTLAAERTLEIMKEEPIQFYQLDVMSRRVSDGAIVRLTNTVGREEYSMLSPDLRTLVFSAISLYVMDLDSGATTPIAENASFCIDPRWSPDGKQIAFAAIDERIENNGPITATGHPKYTRDLLLYIVNSEEVLNLTNSLTAEDFAFDWSHDGSEIAYLPELESGQVQLAIMDVSSRRIAHVKVDIPSSETLESVAWSNVNNVVTVCARIGHGNRSTRTFYDVDLTTNQTQPIGSMESNSTRVMFDRSPDSGQFSIGRDPHDDGNVDELIVNGFPPVCQTRSVVWSYDSQFVTYLDGALPVGFLENLKSGRVLQRKDEALIILESGGSAIIEDQWHQYTPVVKEEPGKEPGETKLVNLTKSEVEKLLGAQETADPLLSQVVSQVWEQ